MVYVDEQRTFDPRFKDYCHMWTDGDAEQLHAFAAYIGLKRSWAQEREGFLHYDISPAFRNRALAAGAQFKPLREFVNERRRSAQR